MNYNLNFKNKKILITGAANGIGLESAVAFLQNGAEVFMADYNEKALSILSEISSGELQESLQAYVDYVVARNK